MPKFIVTKGQDAHVLWEKVFEADSVEHANQLAEADLDDAGWHETGEMRFYDDMTILGDETEEFHPEEAPETLTVTGAERDIILAALRYWQERLTITDPHAIEDQSDILVEIATDGASHPPLDADAIDALCEKIEGMKE